VFLTMIIQYTCSWIPHVWTVCTIRSWKTHHAVVNRDPRMREPVNRSQMDIKHVMYEPGEMYFSTYPPPTMIHLSQHFPSASKPPHHRSFDCCLSHFRTSVSTSSSSAKHLPTRWLLADQTDGSHYGQSPCCKADVQELPTVILKFSPGLLGLYGGWHCRRDEAVPLLPVGLDVFCELVPEASTELHSTMQNPHFRLASENRLTVLPENPKTR
jgi:hypothetical protein